MPPDEAAAIANADVIEQLYPISEDGDANFDFDELD